jgi:hypothetical protein
MTTKASAIKGLNFSRRLCPALQILSAYSYLTGYGHEQVRSFVEMLLDLPNVSLEDTLGSSGLNSDQSPLQLCITLTSDDPRYRLISDPSSDEVNLQRRYVRAKNSLRDTLQLTQSIEMRPLVEKLLSFIGPQNEHHIESFTYGVFWLGASINSRGTAVYVDASVYPNEEAWERAEGYLSSVLSLPEKATVLFEKVRPFFRLSSVGIEGVSTKKSRLKLYVRAATNLPDGLIGNLFPPIDELGRSGCFHLIMGDRGLFPDEILFNIGINPSSSEIEDLKIDISGNALGLSSEETDRIVKQCCQALCLKGIELYDLMRDHSLAISFLGIGIDMNGNKRLNIYLKGTG